MSDDAANATPPQVSVEDSEPIVAVEAVPVANVAPVVASKPAAAPTYPTKRVHIGNIAHQARKSDIETLFADYKDDIANLWVARTPPGFGFAQVREDKVDEFVAKFDKALVLGRPLNVAVSTGVDRRGANSNPQGTNERRVAKNNNNRAKGNGNNGNNDNNKRSREDSLDRRDRRRDDSRDRRRRDDSRDRRRRDDSRDRRRHRDDSRDRRDRRDEKRDDTKRDEKRDDKRDSKRDDKRDNRDRRRDDSRDRRRRRSPSNDSVASSR